MKFFKLGDNARLPVRGSEGAACYDLSSAEEYLLLSGERKLFKTNVGIELEKGTEATIVPRSKLANKFGIMVLAGKIDEDYRGDIGIILYNSGQEALQVEVGSKIAQLEVQTVIQTEPVWIDNQTDTVRGVEGVNSEDLRLQYMITVKVVATVLSTPNPHAQVGIPVLVCASVVERLPSVSSEQFR